PADPGPDPDPHADAPAAPGDGAARSAPDPDAVTHPAARRSAPTAARHGDEAEAPRPYPDVDVHTPSSGDSTSIGREDHRPGEEGAPGVGPTGAGSVKRPAAPIRRLKGYTRNPRSRGCRVLGEHRGRPRPAPECSTSTLRAALEGFWCTV